MSQFEFVRCKNKLTLRGATVGGLRLPKLLKNTTDVFQNSILSQEALALR
jgi:hypothetical protein